MAIMILKLGHDNRPVHDSQENLIGKENNLSFLFLLHPKLFLVHPVCPVILSAFNQNPLPN